MDLIKATFKKDDEYEKQIDKLIIIKNSLTHPDVTTLKSLSLRMPVYDVNGNKLDKEYDDILEPIKLTVFNDKQQKRCENKTYSHILDMPRRTFTQQQHYFAVVKNGDIFYEKNDSSFRILTKEQAKNKASTSAYLVDYQVEVLQ